MSSTKRLSLGPAAGESAAGVSPGAPRELTAEAAGAKWEDFYELTKPRLSFLSVVTAVVGYLAAAPARDLPVLLSLLAGTLLAAGGAAALNQWLEREADARMARTRDRPVAAGRVAPAHALLFGLVLGVTGSLLVYFGTTPLAGSLTAATVASYVLLYTPLKRLTTWNTLIGAVPGALPPLIGWAAAEGAIGALGWLLFAFLFLWQLPHFLAIAWTYRKDYAAAGFVMLSVGDATGRRVAVHALVYTALLFATSLLPVVLGFASVFYGAVALAGGIYLARPALAFLRESRRDVPARKLFLASVFYLPAVLIPLVLDLWLLAPGG